MNVGPTATKKSVLEQLLDQGMVLVALDARVEGVEVPPHLGRDAQLRLNLSYRFGLPMTVDDWGILATLTFAGEPFNCRFPWRSVFLLVSHVSGQPYLFPDDIPAELLSQATAEAGIDAQIFVGQPPATPAASRPKLQLIRGIPADEASPTHETDKIDNMHAVGRLAAAKRSADASGVGDAADDDAAPGKLRTLCADAADKEMTTEKTGPRDKTDTVTDEETDFASDTPPASTSTLPDGQPSTRLSHAGKVRPPRHAQRNRSPRLPKETDARETHTAPQTLAQPKDKDEPQSTSPVPPAHIPAPPGKEDNAGNFESTPPKDRRRKGSHLRVVK